MPGALAGRVALVTGASRGIGAAIARRFAAEGAAVAATARTVDAGGSHLPGSLAEVVAAIDADGGTAAAFAADLADPDLDRAALVAAVEADLGPVDVLVNNAAACFYLPLEQTSGRRLRVAFEVNVLAPYELTRAVVASLRARRVAGHVLDVTSAIAEAPPRPPSPTRLGATRFQSTYAPSKAALNRLTQALALELHDDGIAVNALAPEAAVATEGATAMMDLPEELCEPVETMAEAALALCTGDPRRDTGLVVRSRSFLAERGIAVRGLDGAPWPGGGAAPGR